ncbi:MAG: NAD-glutamate dehydrogenase [Tsuneonella suprasediminis]|uniref:NAD-glutamate dehydrogenase n=1 Tax=Tsuneonella flava TaxID=2055955 RepID=A0ABX7KB10_9SPHN|nr:NAD-glutamate dehydrogenase domain-containing protein [Tsuneonella flava]QSB45003.1 NAD-glutamate dehydrogenase [Tsuneonella flava]UBS33601.1 NAD-glutamate dehydrogenase [Altererythrobacter sp. N1]
MSAEAADSSSLSKSRKSTDNALAKPLARLIHESLLPGDEPLTKARVEEVAQFLIASAAQREPGEPSITLNSASGDRRFMRLALVNDDMPFLVDSIAATIAAHGISIDQLVHPVVHLKRSDTGELAEILSCEADGGKRESLIYIETPRVDARQRRALEKDLRTTLSDVRAAITDWQKMRTAMLDDAANVTDTEGAALLRWLEGGMLTQLGHVTRRRDGSHSAMLGICRKSAKEILADASFDRAFAWFDECDGQAARSPLIVKANRISNVHRRVPLDLFIVPVFEGDKVTALSIHAGVWTSSALAAAPGSVPRLRTQLAELNAKFGFDPNGHAGKSLVHALTMLPHDVLIGFSDADIERVATTMMSLVDRPRPRLVLVEAPLSRHLFAFVWLPRDLLSTQVRTRIQEMLETGAGAVALDWSLQVEGGNLAVIRYVLDYRSGEGSPDAATIEASIQALLRGWSEAVESELATDEDPARAAALATRFADAFPTAYRADYGAAEAAQDIRRLRRLAAHHEDGPTTTHTAPQRDVRLYRHDDDPSNRLRLKIYQSEGALALSDAVPALENFGFRVLEEVPTFLDEGKLGTIHDFTLGLNEGDETEELLGRTHQIENAIAAVLNGGAEDDPFNRLVVGTGLEAREADWLRAFYRYLRQAGIGYTIYTVVDALRRAPDVTRALVGLFAAEHDPAFGRNRKAAAEAKEEAIRKGLLNVAAINDDRLLRLYQALIGAILRTNAFAPAAREALAFKIDSHLVPGLPKPIPWREIFVYSRRLEGIHLRAGPVARGGLRWSDRRDDFRTEILGLMKAQRVKNAVIVPTGAKGGFYPKQLPDPTRDREGWAAEGKASYQAFIRTLLSITDNLVDDKVVHPQDVVIRDGDDPYFVVAADKGTASFSDVANAIAESQNFWLDDAFASGGSNGYDHKAMGITARGAWVSVTRHFLEMGVDVQKDPVRVVGCGDMSGDVFGNGMLLSKSIKLVAAFDHRHIFLDPDPDAAASWKERKRLFDLPRSSWEDYDPSLISKGGGVFARSLKKIPLSKQVRETLGIDSSELEPEALISAILKSPVDLLWFGGIGTYIKASSQSNAEVGDPANDALRVNGEDLRVRVVGEGANLGVTQAGRIEFSLNGGRINADFIDNSAGVDCSDNEVNIKIALAAARRAGRLSEKSRNALLVEMTDEVAQLVLEDNRLQALALSIAESGGSKAMAAQIGLIESLEDRGYLDRKTEGLAESDTLSRRASDGAGLTRPELAVLLSSAKLALQDAIEGSDLPDDPQLVALLLNAFPEPMRGKYAKFIEGHRLRREIIATKLANRIVNRLGPVHPFELAEEEGAGLANIASAFVAAEHLFAIDALWDRLETTTMPEVARIVLFNRVAVAMRSQMADLLRAGAGPISPSQLVSDIGKGVKHLAKDTEELLGAESRQHSARLRSELIEVGASETLSGDVAHLFDLDGAVGLAQLARDADIGARKLTGAFTLLGAELGLDWAQGVAALMNPSDVWERLLVAGLARDFQQMRLEFLSRLARRKGTKADPTAAVEAWATEHTDGIRQFRSMIGRAQAQSPVSPAMLAQIASQARNLLGR